LTRRNDQRPPEAGANGREAASAACFLASIVGATFGVTSDSLLSEQRGRARISLARQVAIYLAHTRLSLPYAIAGGVFHRDRTTAAHACWRVENRREDPRLDLIVDCLERAVDRWSEIAGGGA
jgi:chromosomal replication initiation ATPase DnaA